MADYIYAMETRFSPDQQKAVNLITDVARAHDMNIYLTGGALRDLLTGFPIRDIDLTVQGNPFKLQKDLEKAGAAVHGTEEDSKTLHLLLPGNVRVEVSMSRSATYEKPGKPPKVEPATINEDLRRRDFTVNAMALSLNPGSKGLLADPFNGVADIELKVLRILHNYAFYEEPSRLLRAVRFAARFHWPLEERTQARYDAAKENSYIEYINKDAVGYELEQVAREDNPIEIVRAMEKEGWLKVLHPHWTVAKLESPELTQLLKVRQQMLDFGINVDASPAVMYFMTRKLGDKDIADIQKQIPRRDFVHSWKHLDDGAKDLAKRLSGKEANTVSGTWKLLSSASPEALLFLAIIGRNASVQDKIKNFFGKWRQVREKLPFPEMAELLITPQLPDYPKIADEAFLMLLDGKLRSHNDIIKFLKPYAPPPPPPPPPPPAKRGRKGALAAAAKTPVAAAGAPGEPAKRGRKPKAGAPPVATAPPAAPVPPAAVPAKATAPGPVKSAPAKAAPEVKKAPEAKKAPAPEPKKTAKPEPPKKAVKVAPKKPVSKPAPKKAAPAKKVTKAPAKKKK
ncbi:Polynucleotide adenylyltransferase [Candidatus Koribacter versatilis Ellin345]|uniref:Polynucleotide adenylyltransferase n=1 Tax=Koribacter versatilis (strain Ellin345) TaxID=204669 RepID=Q1IQB2_KORVE|nr:polynucleotide adenylyltransferase [Candidatus Koribacter versatilis]ABF40938.1 Polynucleotide adenylyltransferase [Candidatus Koribacter versatilis Ellin345]